MTIVNYIDWVFEVDLESTIDTYVTVLESGADNCVCEYCKNYVAFRSNVFPKEILDLFQQIGIDSRKEVEITTWEELPNRFQRIGGWFHFKGRVLSGKTYRVSKGEGSYTHDLTKISENFSIGFDKGNDLSYFGKDEELVQVEFETIIPWVLT